MVHGSEVSDPYGILYMLNLYLLDYSKSILSILDGIEHVEYLLAPAGNEMDILLRLADRSLSVSVKVEEVQLCLRILLAVLIPRLFYMETMEAAVPHLKVGEDHHLVHLDVVLKQILDDRLAIGAVSYLSLSALHLYGVRKDVFCWKVEYLPSVPEHSADHRLALALEEHRKQDSDIIKHHAALGGYGMEH